MRKPTWLLIGVGLGVLLRDKMVAEPIKVKSACVSGAVNDANPQAHPDHSVESLKKGEWWQRLESEISAKGIEKLFRWSVLFMLSVGVMFLFKSSAHETIEYFSFVLPISAAIVAGLTVYHENKRGILFVSSLFLLYFGLAAFISLQKHRAEILGYPTLCGAIVVDAYIIRIAVNSIMNIASRNNWRRTLVESVSQLLVVAFAIFLTVYAFSYFHFNYLCIVGSDKSTTNNCAAPWVFWKVFAPWKLFL